MFGGGIRGVVGFAALGHPGQDVLLVLIGKAAAPVHHGELGGRHGVIEDDPFHLGQHGLAHGAVLALHQLLVEVQGTDAVPVILFDDAADAGDLGVERQVIAAGMAGHALVLHDARDTGELVLHIVQPLRRGGGTGQQHEGCGSQQFFLHIVLLGGRCRDGITGFAGIAGAFFHKWCIMSTVIFTIIKITYYFLYIFMDDIRTAHSIA